MARKSKRRSQQNPADPGRKRLNVLLALIGTLIGAGLGYAFGYYVVPGVDTDKHFFTTPQASAMLFLWGLGVAGAVVGLRMGENLYHARRHREQQEARRARYGDQLARYEQEKAEIEARQDGYEGDRLPTPSKKAKAKGYESPWP
jgi:hypothetical protein